MTRFLLLFLLSFSFSFAKDDCPEELNLAEKLNDHVAASVTGFKHRGYISPEELRTLSSKEIGERIVERIAAQCDDVRGGATGKTMGEESDIMMFVPSGVLEGIEQYGFQNQHVTRTTNGCNCREDRYRAEGELSGILVGYGPKAKEVLPKYSALSINKSGRLEGGGDASSYGDTIFMFKDDVKKRTTWTEIDSLMTKPFRGSRVVNGLSFQDKDDDPVKCKWGYCEAQIWGSLDLSDVDYVMIAPGAEVPEVLKRNKIPVYYRVSAEGENTGGFKKGELAYKGDPSRKIASIDEQSFTPSESTNPVTERIENHKKLSKSSNKDLIEKYDQSADKELKREIVGELILRTDSSVKDFLLSNLPKSDDGLLTSQILTGLSPFGSDKKVREAFSEILKKIEASGGDVIVERTILAIVADTPGFKDDKALLNALEEKAKKDEKFRIWYNRFFRHQSLCPRKGHPDFLPASSW